MTKQEAIYRNLIKQIKEGSLAYGEKVPSIRAYAEEKGFGIQTVLRAYQKLQDDGWIESNERSGFFVRSPEPVQELQEDHSEAHRLFNEPLEDKTIHELLKHLRDESFINFGALVPDYKLFNRTEIVRAVKKNSSDVLNYGHAAGSEKLLMKLFSSSVWPKEKHRSISLTNGALHSVSLSLMCICKPGDIIAIESPFYYGFKGMILAKGLKPLELKLDQKTGLSSELVAKLHRKFKFKALICTSSFSNPSGVTTCEEEKKEIVKLAETLGFFIVEDNVYGDLFYHRKKSNRFIDFDEKLRVFYCSSMSKTYACGVKLGWLVAPQKFQQKINSTKLAYWGFQSELNESIALDLLRSRRMNFQIKRMREKYAANVERTRAIIQNESGGRLQSSSPKGGYFLWIKGEEGFDSFRLFEDLKKEKILISPGCIFSFSEDYLSYFRLNCGIELTDKRLAALRKIIEFAGRQTKS